MSATLIIATAQGVNVCQPQDGAWQVIQTGLVDQAVTSVIAREGVILAGTRQGVFRSDDMGGIWQAASNGLEHRHVRWMAYDPEISDAEFAGTEPAAIYRSRDGGQSWQACPEVAGLRERYGWYLPYSPEAGCVRGFAFQGRRAYAAVEVGGVLVSQDGGAHWQMAAGSSGDPNHAPEGNVHPDVHSILVHPTAPELVFAPTGGGFYRSQDGGRTWELLYDCYCRAAWVDPADAAHLLLGPAEGVDREGRIEESRDGGRTWQPAAAGLKVPWPQHMVERFYPAGDTLLAVLSNGELLAASLQKLSWSRILNDVKWVNAVTVMA